MRLSSIRRPAWCIGAALVTALATPAAAGVATAEAPPPAPPPAGGAQRAPATVTLITGDKVTVTPGPTGTVPKVSIQRAPGATGSVRVSTEGGSTYVYPDEAVGYVAAGRLDKRLFDVTQLIAQGYDDGSTSELPLILTHKKDSPTLKPTGAATPKPRATQGTPAPKPGAALPGAEVTLSLPVVHGEAVKTHRSKTAAFWSGLTGLDRHRTKPPTGRTDGTPGTAPAPPFAAGVDKVWLDGKAKATLADTTAQIGAPAAWASGGTGTGVRVAVLDTGVDTEHPDLAKHVVSSRSFVPGEDIVDRHGHGTHTASTVAGTGAASDDRKERGVAPDADLLVGKVLSNKGMGLDSWVIAGMEWAARTERAKVINMSLGDPWQHGQTDPVSQALNRLSAETGALFVVSAGNDGHTPYNLGAPGTAESALTVGAVDSADNLAPFSSYGPRLLDDGLKPDITAPGVGVLAARSQYMAQGEGPYAALDGTSMAAPHVAGAAVLMAQKHPDWTGQQIKHALMSTSMRKAGYNPYQAGTGRVSVPAAYYGQVFATGSVDAGLVPWSSTARPQPIERKITYTNLMDSPVTLDLSVDPGDSSARPFTLGADRVIVPARGTAQVDLVVDPEGLAAGRYAAQVMASGSGATGAISVHTAVGVSVEAEKRNLTVELKDRSGRPMSGVVLISGDNGVHSSVWIPKEGSFTSRWAPGTYTLRSYTDVEGAHGPHSLGAAVLVAPEVDLTADRKVELDASRARQVKVATPKPTAIAESRIDVWRSFTSTEPEPGTGHLFDVLFPSAGYDSLWALPTKGKVKKGSFAFGTRFRAEQTPLDISYSGKHLDDALLQPGSKPLVDGTSRLETVFAGNGTQAEYAGVSARGKAVVVRSTNAVPTDQAAAAEAAGAAMLLVVNQGPGRISDWWYGKPDHTTAGSVPVASVTRDEGEVLIKELTSGNKRVRLAVEAHPSPEYLYDLADHHIGAVPEDPSAKTGPRDLARVDVAFALPPGKQGSEMRDDYPPYHWEGPPRAQLGNALSLPFRSKPIASRQRTDWVSAGGVRWQQSATIGTMLTRTDTLSYKAGSVQKENWFGPITRPRMLTNNVLLRFPNGTFATHIQGYGDAGAAHTGLTGGQTISVYQGDKRLVQTPIDSVFVGDLEPEKLPYRLVVDTMGNPEHGPYSTTTKTEWSFTSGHATEEQEIPLVQLDYGTNLDVMGRAERRTDLSILPTVLGGTSAEGKVSSVGLEVSYDDGRTWQRHTPKRKKDAWQASLNAPSNAQYVSIRVTARQPNGSGITQTITRAFGLRP